MSLLEVALPPACTVCGAPRSTAASLPDGSIRHTTTRQVRGLSLSLATSFETLTLVPLPSGLLTTVVPSAGSPSCQSQVSS